MNFNFLREGLGFWLKRPAGTGSCWGWALGFCGAICDIETITGSRILFSPPELAKV